MNSKLAISFYRLYLSDILNQEKNISRSLSYMVADHWIWYMSCFFHLYIKYPISFLHMFILDCFCPYIPCGWHV